MDLKVAAAFSFQEKWSKRKSQEISFESWWKFLGTFWGVLGMGMQGGGRKLRKLKRRVALQRAKMVLEAEKKVSWWVLSVHHSISFSFSHDSDSDYQIVNCLFIMEHEGYFSCGHAGGIGGGNTGCHWCFWEITRCCWKFFKWEFFISFHLNKLSRKQVHSGQFNQDHWHLGDPKKNFTLWNKKKLCGEQTIIVFAKLLSIIGNFCVLIGVQFFVFWSECDCVFSRIRELTVLAEIWAWK